MGERDVRNVEASGSIPLTSTKTHGAIAQLGERLHGMQEVGGSNLPGSTSQEGPSIRGGKGSKCGGSLGVKRNLATV